MMINLKAERSALLEMMQDAKASRDANNRPDARCDDMLTRALAGDWTWQNNGAARRHVEPPQLPVGKPTTDASSNRADSCTDNQVRYLNVLFSKIAALTGATPVVEVTDGLRETLSKKAASALIDKLTAQVEKLETKAGARYIGDPRAYPSLTLPAEIRQQTPAIPEGRYAVRGTDQTVDFYQVDHGSGPKWAGYVFASLLTGAPGGWAQQRLSKPATATLLQRIEAAGIEASARLFGDTTRTCGNCGSPLSDPQSRVAGYGETCAGMHGYWYPTKAEALEILDEGVAS